MVKSSKLSPDVVMKDFWRDNERFADLFNAYFFHGEKVVDPRELIEMDTDVSSLTMDKQMAKTRKSIRDVIKRTTGGCYQILAIENQQHIHYAMPLRCMSYEVQTYTAQTQTIRKRHIPQKNWANQHEFLSKFKKTDKLIPCFSIVLYYGEQKWDGPTELAEMMELPEKINPDYFNNYKMNLIALNEKSKYPFHQKSVNDFFTLVYSIYHLEKEEMPKSMLQVSTNVVLAAAVVTGVEKKYRNILISREEGVVNMCEAVRRVMEKEREAGKTEGKAEGKAEERRRLLGNALTNGFDKGALMMMGFSEQEIERAIQEFG